MNRQNDFSRSSGFCEWIFAGRRNLQTAHFAEQLAEIDFAGRPPILCVKTIRLGRYTH
jgi:hypothetical protein